MKRAALCVAALVAAVVMSSPSVAAQEGEDDSWAALAALVLGLLPEDEFEFMGVPLSELDDGPPANGAAPDQPPNYPPVIDAQQGVAFNIVGDLSEWVMGTPCGGGMPPNLNYACPGSMIDPALFADGALVFGTQLGAAMGPDGLPGNIGHAILFSHPDGTPFAGPWPFAGATGALRYVPGGPLQQFNVGPDGMSFTMPPGPLDVFMALPPDSDWIWTFLPRTSQSAQRIDGVQWHLFIDRSPVSDTIPGNPGDATTVAPFDASTIGTATIVTEPTPPPPPADDPADDPTDAPTDEEETAPPSATDDDSSGIGKGVALLLAALGLTTIGGGVLLMRSKKGPCEELLELVLAAEDECAKATKAAQEAEQEADRKRKEYERARDAWPPASFPPSNSSGNIDGFEFSGRDLQLLHWDSKVSAPDAWSEPGGQTEADIARRAEEARQRLDELRARDKEAMDKIDPMRRAAEEAAQRAMEVRRWRDDVCAKARAARENYTRRCPGADGGGATTTSTAVVAPPTAAVPAGWPQVVARENQVQQEIANAMQGVGEELARAYASFGGIAGSFATPFRRAVAGTAPLDELAQEAQVDVEFAKTADLVLAFVQITNLAVRGIVGGVKLGIRAWQWFTKVPDALAVTDDAVRAADDALKMAEGVVRHADQSPTPMGRVLSGPLLSEPPVSLGGDSIADVQAWMIGHLARQLGITVEQALAKGRAISREALIDLLKTQVVQARGLWFLSDAAQFVLDRILSNVRAASRGQLSGMSRADLRQFFEWVDQGLLTHLDKAVDPSTVYVHLANEMGRVLALFDDAELTLLRLVSESPELRRIAFEPPTGFGSMPELIRLSDGRTVGVLVDDAVTGIWRLSPTAPAAPPPFAPPFTSHWLNLFPYVPPGAAVQDVMGTAGLVRTIFGTTEMGIVGGLPPQVAAAPAGTDPAALAAANHTCMVVVRDGDSLTVVQPPSRVPAGTDTRFSFRAGYFADAAEEVRSLIPPTSGTYLVRPRGVGLAGWTPESGPLPGLGGPPLVDLGFPAPPFRALESGLVTGLTSDQIRLVDTALAAARDAATGGPPMDPALLARLSAIATDRAGGWDRIADAVLAGTNTYAVPFGLMDVGLLQAAVASGGDPTVLAEAMGPVPANLLSGAASATFTLRSMAELGAFDPALFQQQAQSFQGVYESLGAIPDLHGYTNQFLRDEVRSHDFNLFGFDLEAGSGAAEFGWIFVKMLSEPITTITQRSYEEMAQGLLNEYLAVHTPDLVDMVGVIDRAVGFLHGLDQAIGRWQEGLGALAVQLVGVLDDVRKANFDPVREAHIARKHADLLRSLGSLQELKLLAGNLAGWIDSLLTVPGQEGVTDVTADQALRLVGPTSVLRLGSALLQLGSGIADVLLVAPAPRPLVLSPENEEIYRRQQEAAAAAQAERERLDSMSDEEREAYEAEQEAAEAREQATLDADIEAQFGDR